MLEEMYVLKGNSMSGGSVIIVTEVQDVVVPFRLHTYDNL